MYTLDSGWNLHKEFPDSFEIPTHERISKLEKDDYVKLIFREDCEVERMWVRIREPMPAQDGKLSFVGVLDNEPYGLESIKCGDTVNFSEEHIIQTMD